MPARNRNRYRSLTRARNLEEFGDRLWPVTKPALSLLVMGESQKGMRCGITSGTRMKPGADGAWLLLYGLYGWGYVNPWSELLKIKIKNLLA